MDTLQTVYYKGKEYIGSYDGSRLILKPIKGLLKRELVLKPNKIVIITKRALELLNKNTHSGKIESAGMLLGNKKKNILFVKSIMNFPKPSKPPKGGYALVAKAFGGGYGFNLASDWADRIVASRRDVIGFYHSHPTRDKLSPGDRKEFAEASKFPHLKEPIKFHILCRMSGLHRRLSKYPLLPIAYYKTLFGYKEIPIIVKE